MLSVTKLNNNYMTRMLQENTMALILFHFCISRSRDCR